MSFSGPDAKAPLTALLSRPKGPGPFPALVLLHGYSGMYGKSGRLGVRQIQWDGTMRATGFVILRGDSFTPMGIREVCTVKNRSITVWKDRRADALTALSFLRSQPFVRPDAVAVMGCSMGGLTAIAAMDPDTGFTARISSPAWPSIRGAGWMEEARRGPPGPCFC